MSNLNNDSKWLYDLACSGMNSLETPGYQSAMIAMDKPKRKHHEYIEDIQIDDLPIENRKFNLHLMRRKHKNVLNLK